MLLPVSAWEPVREVWILHAGGVAALRVWVAQKCHGWGRRHDATGVLEHPAEDELDVTQPSIWRLALIQMLLWFKACRRVRGLQGHFGAHAVQLTGLCLVNVHEEAEEMLVKARYSQ